jgi:osmotically-inducible protein OsmY
VSGVANIDDRLTLDPSMRGVREQTGDAALQTKVMAAIAGQAGVNALKITVTADNGVVTLEGTVPRASVRSTVVDTARTTSGVRRVVDRLSVKP